MGQRGVVEGSARRRSFNPLLSSGIISHLEHHVMLEIQQTEILVLYSPTRLKHRSLPYTVPVTSEKSPTSWTPTQVVLQCLTIIILR